MSFWMSSSYLSSMAKRVQSPASIFGSVPVIGLDGVRLRPLRAYPGCARARREVGARPPNITQNSMSGGRLAPESREKCAEPCISDLNRHYFRCICGEIVSFQPKKPLVLDNKPEGGATVSRVRAYFDIAIRFIVLNCSWISLY